MARMSPRRVVVSSTLAVLLPAQEPEPLTSGPPAGTALPACPVAAPAGPFAGSEFDAAAKIGDGPGVLLFVHELSRNTAPMITGLDTFAVEFAWTGLSTHSILVAADRTAAEAQAERSSNAMRMYRPLLVSVDGVDGPGGYALHRNATLTIVTAKDGKVVRSVAFTDTGRNDLPRLRELVEEVAGPVPEDAAALERALADRLPQDAAALRRIATELALLLQRQQRVHQQRNEQQQRRQQMRRDGEQARGDGERPAREAQPREGKAPDDDRLRALLRRAIQPAAGGDELAEVYTAVDARVGDDAALRQQAIDMFRLQLSLGYGNDDSQKRARAWLDANGGK
jgi:hypothetical protein